MRLSPAEKTEEIFQTIKEISDVSFSGVERPPEEALRYHFTENEVFVCGFHAEPITSFALVTYDGGEPYIWGIATRLGSRGKGYASVLLDEIRGHYWSLRESGIALTVNVNNPAQKLYFDKGFRVVKFIPRRYRDVAGLRMRRAL